MNNFCVKVNPETSRLLQEIALEDKWTWRSGGGRIDYTDKPVLCFSYNCGIPNKGKVITHADSMGELYSYVPISVDEALINLGGTKSFLDL